MIQTRSTVPYASRALGWRGQRRRIQAMHWAGAFNFSIPSVFKAYTQDKYGADAAPATPSCDWSARAT